MIMLSPGAVALLCFLGSAEGYATVRDDRVFASSRDQQSKNSTTSDHDGDMKVSVRVQADASVSELKENMDGVQEVQTLKATDDAEEWKAPVDGEHTTPLEVMEANLMEIWVEECETS